MVIDGESGEMFARELKRRMVSWVKVHCAICTLLTGLRVFQRERRREVRNGTILVLSQEDGERAFEGTLVTVG